MEEEKILENITKSISERLKVPIILTYVCVLFLYNWDILFYLFFESSSATSKIQFIQKTYGKVYYYRILHCLIIAVLLIISFTMLNTAINFCLKWFYRKDKQITSEIESYEQVNILTEQLSNSIDEIKKLKSQIENLKTINESLNSKKMDFAISEISEKDLDRLMIRLNKFPTKEKYLYSFKELIQTLKKDIKVSKVSLYQTATYEQEMRGLIDILIDMNLIKTERYLNDNQKSSYDGIGLGTSFKDFLKMEI